jgi:hypothetical protein
MASIVRGNPMKSPNPVPVYALVLLASAMVQAQVVNGSFEDDMNGHAPSNWLVTGGTVSVSDVADCLFPSTGSKYLVVDSYPAGPAFPGYGPHGWNNTGQARQTVVRPAGQFCVLSIDWEFLPGEPVPQAFYNDFLSIDVINATTDALIRNVVYVDSGFTAGNPPYTNVPGAGAGQLTWVPNQSLQFPFTTANPAPAGLKRAIVDLSMVPVGTAMTIEINVGNGGDAEGPSRAYIDRVEILGGQQNFNSGNAALRVLGSAHQDGIFNDFDWSDDILSFAPYHFRACPGQKLSFRARGEAGHPWILAAGNLLEVGVPTAAGQINVDLFSGAPFSFLANGFAGDPTMFPGVLGGATSWFNVDVPEGVLPGTQLTVQAAMQQIGGALAASAATTLEVGPPQVPKGTSNVGGGAITDDGSTNQIFAAFGSWPFYGVSRTSVNVNSNGSLTFGAGDPDPTESESEMLAGPARIAPVWDDLFPPGGSLIRSTQTASTYTVSWMNLQESSAGLHGNNVAVQLYQAAIPTAPAGIFTIYFGSTTMDDGLTGISPGGLPAPAPGASSSNVDWTAHAASLGARGTIPAGSAKLERFALGDDGLPRDLFDLISIGGFSRITFVPDGVGGYTYFVGTR